MPSSQVESPDIGAAIVPVVDVSGLLDEMLVVLKQIRYGTSLMAGQDLSLIDSEEGTQN